MNAVELFYKNSTVLVTVPLKGADAFLGKVLVEKLLRCFDVKEIYILMMTKYNEKVTDGPDSYFDAEV
jgi:alcohol-forming fatty acyl-CoA reductase